ncbi:class I SAM-dependent methyltransferase [bacterium]|nr:class I SAM-dependent methyltransferase [bacterium]
MFRNIINIHDLVRLYDKSKQGYFRKFASKLFRGKKSRVKISWSGKNDEPHNWWDIPAVQKRWNFLITGDKNTKYYEYIAKKHFSKIYDMKGLSLACGTGNREIYWAKLADFAKIDAFDISPARIEVARKLAKTENLDHIISFEVGDVLEMEFEKNAYDVVFIEQALHHFSPLDKILVKIENVLKPDGYLILNEFVGPSRFQWTKRQLEIANELLSAIPEKYRTIWRTNRIKRKIYSPGKLSMFINDPSEADESAEIIPLLKKHFDILELKGYGGAILHLLFADIAQNFLTDDNETQNILEFCFAKEDDAMRMGEVENDFVVAVGKKRDRTN